MKKTIRLSSKGQLVVPAWVRKRLSLAAGDEFTIEVPPGSGKTIILKGRSGQEVQRLLEKGYRWLKATREDPLARLNEARRREREREKKRRPA